MLVNDSFSSWVGNLLVLIYCSEDLATHPNILISSLQKLSKHENPVILLAVCENLNTPEALRNKLLK